MPKTVVGLFENRSMADGAARDIEALGFPRHEVRTVTEPATFEVTGVMSFPRLDFETNLVRGLTRIGATQAQAEVYKKGLQRGGALVFATGTEAEVEVAADIMNREGAVRVAEGSGPEPYVPAAASATMTPMVDSAVQAGRIRESGGGAQFFVW